jgi:HEAT repeat protein
MRAQAMGIVDDIIEEARSGDSDNAFHNLRELDHSFLPAMQTAYRCEDDPIVRSMIVEAIWQHRQASEIDFLAEVLRDPTPEVWKQALDGLVTLASPESMRVLRSAADREDGAERRAWIEEAIEKVDDAFTRRE